MLTAPGFPVLAIIQRNMVSGWLQGQGSMSCMAHIYSTQNTVNSINESAVSLTAEVGD